MAILFVLSIIGYILAGTLALAFLLAAIALSVPITYEIHADSGLVKVDFRLFWFIKLPRKARKTRKVKKAKSRREKPKKKVPMGKVISFATQTHNKDEIARGAFRLLRRVLKVLKPQKLRAKFLVGMDNPAHTGLILGFLGIIKSVWGDGLEFDGDFNKEVLEYNIYVRDTFVLWPLFWACLLFALRRPVRKFIGVCVFLWQKNKKGW